LALTLPIPVAQPGALEGEAEHRHAGLQQALEDLGGGALRRDTGGQDQLHLAGVAAPRHGADVAGGEDLHGPWAQPGRDIDPGASGCRSPSRDLGDGPLGDDPAAVEDPTRSHACSALSS
jgi:hypothetical protein